MPPTPSRFRSVPTLETLECRDVPAFLTGAELVVGTDAGGPPIVSLIDPVTQVARSKFLAFEGTFYGGVRVAVGDVTGDAVPDLVTGAGPSGGPAVKVFNGKTGEVVASFFAYGASFTGGVYVATGDVTGDGVAEIITGAGAGGGPQVSVFDGDTGRQLSSFFAYASTVRSGVRVASGDVDGDRRADIVTAPGYGGGPHIRTFSMDSSTLAFVATSGFMAFDPSFIGGLNVAVGNVIGDEKAEIVTGAGATGGPQVSVFTPAGDMLASFFAYGTDFRGGVRVGVADLTGDRVGEIITAAGPGGGSQVNVYSLPDANPTAALFALPTEQLTGVWVDGAAVPLNIPPTDPTAIEAAYTPLRDADRANIPLTLVPYPVGVPTPVPYWYSGYGFYNPYWIGPMFYDAPGLFLGLNYFYGPGFFNSPSYFGSPGYSLGTGYYNTGYYDPGYYGTGFTDSSYYDPSYSDPGFSNPVLSDPGYSDYYYDDSSYFDDSFYYDDSFFSDGGGFYDGGFDEGGFF